MFPFVFLFFFLMSFTSSAFFSLFSGLLWLMLLCVISHVSHALCISRYLMPLFTLFPLSLPLVGFFSVRASCNFTQFIQNQMGFFCLPSLHSPHSVFYFILFQLSVYFCLYVCVQSLKAISMVVAFLANFLYAVVGVSFGGSNSHSSLIECFYYAK